MRQPADLLHPASTSNGQIHTNPSGVWHNKHQNVSQPYERLYDVWNPSGGGDPFAAMRSTASALQGLIGQAIRGRKRLRAYGGKWSLSHAPVTNGRLLNSKAMNWRFFLKPRHVEPRYQGRPEELLLVQSGVSVKEANEVLAEANLALKTSGASNGQTMVGAISTGTHGSAFGFGSMPDYVVGIHLLTGPNTSIWLERASYPVVNEQFAQRLGAQLKRDDALFNAALVSFGSFGIINSLLIEATPLYLLNATRWRVPYDVSPGSPLHRAMTRLDFSGLQMPQGGTPHHFEVVVNTHDLEDGVFLTAMYKQPYSAAHQPPPPPRFGGLSPGEDLLGVIGALATLLPDTLVKPFVNEIIGRSYKTYRDVVGTPGEIFSSTTLVGKGMSMELGVPPEYCTQIIDFVRACPQVQRYAGVIGIRYVKKSTASLGFTKFGPITCTLEFQAAYSEGTQALYDFVWAELERRRIPYTLHWGQMNHFTPQRVRAMYGAAVDSWIRSREALLDANSRAVFTSPFLESTGLNT
jgi:hypothetical protein